MAKIVITTNGEGVEISGSSKIEKLVKKATKAAKEVGIKKGLYRSMLAGIIPAELEYDDSCVEAVEGGFSITYDADAKDIKAVLKKATKMLRKANEAAAESQEELLEPEDEDELDPEDEDELDPEDEDELDPEDEDELDPEDEDELDPEDEDLLDELEEMMSNDEDEVVEETIVVTNVSQKDLKKQLKKMRKKGLDDTEEYERLSALYEDLKSNS